MYSRFRKNDNFNALSIGDILEAQEQYHIHIANLDHVVATAVGLFRIRKKDPDYESPLHGKAHRSDVKRPRTLFNSGIRPWSWPCLLVFVDEWLLYHEFASKPEQMVPPRLYLPDGRSVLTCIIHTPNNGKAQQSLPRLSFPSGLFGGGYPIIRVSQDREQIGSAGCLVTDGAFVYVLTSRHVAGEPGDAIHTMDRGKLQSIGVAGRHFLGKKRLQEVYPGLSGSRMMVNVDAGLVRLDELSRWTAQVYGIGKMGSMIDINVDRLSLDLIGCPVKAYGAASGLLRGEIQGLFYRYRSVGGFDYVSELIIGPREEMKEGEVMTRPGDSGTLWFWDETAEKQDDTEGRKDKLVASGNPSSEAKGKDPAQPKPSEFHPLAIQWGGHTYLEPGGGGNRVFALAGSLGTVCRMLNVELIRDWSIEHSEFWGKAGHYKIAYSACFMLKGKAKKFFEVNATNISVSDADLESGQLPNANNQDEFFALADVPDLVWRRLRKMDAANHFADLDQKAENGPFAGKTLMGMWQNDPKTLRPEKWTEFYDNLPDPPEDRHCGALPFRVWQLYDAMTGFIENEKAEEFLCAAGVLAHYVCDACIPLHVSMLHHGHPDKPGENAVHSYYETTMLDRFAVEVVAQMQEALRGKSAEDTIRGGEQAANLVMQLSEDALKALQPETIIDAFNANAGSQRTAGMWNALSADTIKVMAGGATALATLWASAWQEANGDDRIHEKYLTKKISSAELRRLYHDKRIVESKWLKDMKLT
jgi:hypothetical protein